MDIIFEALQELNRDLNLSLSTYNKLVNIDTEIALQFDTLSSKLKTTAEYKSMLAERKSMLAERKKATTRGQY